MDSDLHTDEFLSSTEKAPGMKELLVAINIGKDTDDSMKRSSKTTSGQSSPLIMKGQLLLAFSFAFFQSVFAFGKFPNCNKEICAWICLKLTNICLLVNELSYYTFRQQKSSSAS